MKALILAAGYATRMYPLTKDYPKPLLDVGGRPIIDYIIEKIERVDAIDEILVVTNSKFYGEFQKWAAALQCSKPIVIVDDLSTDESNKRGAIGDTHFALQQRSIDDDVLIIGGDNLFDGDLAPFFDFVHQRQGQPVIGVFDIKDIAHASKYGVVKIDASQRIVEFQEKPAHPQSTLVAMCLYYLSRQKSDLINDYIKGSQNKRDATGFFIDWLSKKEYVYAYVFSGRWFDIGHMSFYDEARKWKSGNG